ncbi:hypothetical protein HGRIS_009610 [Hohenbuehelia grisea]|uniref:Uncharacterized protein n=1 Tax=Hohenbuehelia grisea TaxID=104357 RepID=A0ABR3J1P1_9AGAR
MQCLKSLRSLRQPAGCRFASSSTSKSSSAPKKKKEYKRNPNFGMAALPDKKMRALVNLYHESANFITPGDLVHRINVEFACGKESFRTGFKTAGAITYRDLEHEASRLKDKPRIKEWDPAPTRLSSTMDKYKYTFGFAQRQLVADNATGEAGTATGEVGAENTDVAAANPEVGEDSGAADGLQPYAIPGKPWSVSRGTREQQVADALFGVVDGGNALLPGWEVLNEESSRVRLQEPLSEDEAQYVTITPRNEVFFRSRHPEKGKEKGPDSS